MLNLKTVSGANSVPMRRKIGISAIIYLVYAAYYISGYSSRMHNYILVALFGAWLFFAVVEDLPAFNKAIGSRTLAWAFVFLVYYFFTSFLNGDLVNTLEYVAKYIMFFSCVMQFKYYKIRNNPKELIVIVTGILAAWAFFALKAILFYIAVPSAARTLASDFYAFDSIAIGGGYAIAFGSAILCNYFFERLVNKDIAKKRAKGLFIAFVAVLFFLLIKTESTLTLIACCIGMVYAVIRKIWRNGGVRNDIKNLALTIILVLVSLLIMLNIQEIGEWIMSVTENGMDNTILRRFYRVGQKMAYSGTGSTYENYVDDRLGYVKQSWTTFLKNPIAGVGYMSGNIFSRLESNGVGMHSAICDLLAQHGLLGAIPFIVFFVRALKKECAVHCNAYILTVIFMVAFNPFDYFHPYACMFTLIPMIELLNDRANKSQ